ncbi:hypothetical protein BHM03_00022859 [Ensete ventricosum]|uniref:AB hydrolase-1 domain-containing protein n=1 Tax=Ensete ventricosum TaxID=4639 RepID=A0A445MGH5_ENSVE|nr:hypothetical protein BHM03_00022859 [Ensete ventricosum]
MEMEQLTQVEEMGAEFNKSRLSRAATLLNSAVSFLVFSFLDVLDVILCVVYKLVDYAMETDSRPCYCSPEEVTISGDFLVSATKGGRTVVRMAAAAAAAKLRFGDVSDTLHYRPSQVAELAKRAATAVGYKTRGSIGFTVSSDVMGALKEQTNATKSSHRMFAVDLLGFGRSPKPTDSLYTLREQVEMIEKSILKRHNVGSFHIVAHSMGCIIALALAVEHPEAVKSLALIAPVSPGRRRGCVFGAQPYFPVPEGEKAKAAQFVMRQVAPKKVWPPMMFGASIACWYEHVGRTVCVFVCRNHRFWEFLFRLITRNRLVVVIHLFRVPRSIHCYSDLSLSCCLPAALLVTRLCFYCCWDRIRSYMIEAFMCHTHRAAWHSLHNVICGSAETMEGCMDSVSRRSCCDVAVFHGGDDDVIPVDCSYAVGSRIPRARVKVFQRKDHVTIVVGHHKALAGELERIWRNAGCPTTE